MKHSVTDLNATNIVDFIGSIFEKRGDEEYLGEPVTMGQHMLQGATMAEKSREPDEIIIGTLLHDIGHFTSEFGTFSMEDTEDRYHEDAGAAVLEQFFPKIITDCCRHHVAAKRYLCATDPEYFQKLSTASIHSLNLQEQQMLERYFKQDWQNYWRPYNAMKCASLMRETLWSMVSEIYSEIDFDYAAYTVENLNRFNGAMSDFKNT